MSTNKKYIVFALVIASTFIIIINLINSIKKDSNSKYVSINNHKFNLETVDDELKRSKGLSGRNYLPKDSGMIFIFPTKGIYYFWMKDMRFPLDFIWIDKERIVDLTENVLPPVSNNINLPTFSSFQPIDKVMEVNAGSIKLWNIKKGDIAVFKQ